MMQGKAPLFYPKWAITEENTWNNIDKYLQLSEVLKKQCKCLIRQLVVIQIDNPVQYTTFLAWLMSYCSGGSVLQQNLEEGI